MCFLVKVPLSRAPAGRGVFWFLLWEGGDPMRKGGARFVTDTKESAFREVLYVFSPSSMRAETLWFSLVGLFLWLCEHGWM